MSDAVDFTKRGAIGVITVNSPPVNALSAAVRDGLGEAFEQGQADPEIKAMVLLGGGRTFIAGADIREFGQPPKGRPFHDVLKGMENSSKLIVAAIHGTALGGGLETALCCHYRFAVPASMVGLPEVKLGLLPGAGGTQRLPRLVGVPKALDLITSGDFVPAPQAKELGIVDEVGDDLLEGAIAFAEKLVAEDAPLRKIRDMPCEADDGVFEAYRKTNARKFRGFLAPWKCIDCVEAAATLEFDAGMARERELFNDCVTSPESAAQRHVFFAEREVAKIPDVPKDTPMNEVKKVAMIGAGTMGGGIAMNFTNAGIPVLMVEVAQDALDRGMGIIERNYQNTVNKGRLSQDKMDQRMALFSTTTDFADIGDADLVIEAVFEKMELKKEIFAKLDAHAKPGAVLASNTSTLDIDEIASATKRPESVIGMHFFSPANVMRLLEVVRGKDSSPETIATAMGMGRKVGKISVLVGNCFGFVGNRMLHGYSGEGSFLLEGGALPQQVDAAIYDFGLAMGPFAMGDMAGLDVGWLVRKAKAADRPTNEEYGGTIPDRICELGRFGQKTAGGYYDYKEGDRTPIPNGEVQAIIEQVSKEKNIARKDFDEEEIIKRSLYPLVNIGAQILDEGMAMRPSDIDIIYINGYGFPAHKGGPMHWADAIGLDKVLADIKRFHADHGERWRPAPLLEKLVAEGKSFADYQAG
ncbi:MAG: 3-hydroxyacyl-CoA dehydrogenase [Rhodospirillaceae bacterium]|jgi:3-hydroxyacyl-CoA dehydrogenase|nr:3-hydroxyacyl-CoA dehydrogenase [Rhodospirillaceae bacterium]MBT5894490.1 3-hydroxyacyl-CoA dehydrogenase [Rhodospirillaceae bacterium]MBT6426296.1 3-hydroxyacyl-CoA dehydrogenase [Rhodospirillaceae bacterium]MBT7756164.1 3-hydroxyacyl-CoA dehydrogenase [Rhodospirillaceae bacterium]